MNTQFPIKINSLTGLRALLAGMVLLVHGADIVGWLQGSSWIYAGMGNLGHFGVMGFFILSGLILTIVYDQKEWTLREFFTNRFARLYPLYVSAIIFSFCLDWFGANASQVDKLEALLLTLGGGQAWFPFANGRFNGPSWTISVELFFYCCFPFLFWLKLRSGFHFRVLVLLLFIGTVALWDSSQFLTSYRFPPMRLWEFALGMILSDFLLKYRNSLAKPWIPAILLILCGPFLGGYCMNELGWDFSSWLLMGGCGAGALLLLGNGDLRNVSSKPLSSPHWILAGEISYGLYLLHYPILRYLKVAYELLTRSSILDANLVGKICYIIISALISIIVSYFSWRYIETPSRKFLRRYFSKSDIRSIERKPN